MATPTLADLQATLAMMPETTRPDARRRLEQRIGWLVAAAAAQGPAQEASADLVDDPSVEPAGVPPGAAQAAQEGDEAATEARLDYLAQAALAEASGDLREAGRLRALADFCAPVDVPVHREEIHHDDEHQEDAMPGLDDDLTGENAEVMAAEAKPQMGDTPKFKAGPFAGMKFRNDAKMTVGGAVANPVTAPIVPPTPEPHAEETTGSVAGSACAVGEAWGNDAHDDIVRYLKLVTSPGDVIELRILEAAVRGTFRTTIAGYFDTDHLDALADVALEWTERADGVYTTINPVIPDLLARKANRAEECGKKDRTTGDKETARRVGLVIDAEPERAAGISSTDAEKELGRCKLDAVRQYLSGLGWPTPLLGDSGNGYHLRYAIDLPADDRGIVERCLKALAAKFTDDKVKIDTSLFNPSRIIKLYGTMARKGDHTEARPHRWARVISAPDRLEIVPRELLEALAATAPADPPKGGKATGQAGKAAGKSTSEGRPEAAAKKAGEQKPGAGVLFPETGLSPVEDFEENTDWLDILPEGRSVELLADERTYFTRPGKAKGKSASAIGNFFHVFSDNAAPFEANANYSKLDVFALLHHDGDKAAAVKALVADGYGTYIDHDGTEKENPPPADWAKVKRAKTSRAAAGGGPKDGGKAAAQASGGATVVGQATEYIPYVEHDGRTFLERINYKTGEVDGEDQLADFTARIVREERHHGPGGDKTRFVVEGRHHAGRVSRVRVDADRYARMEWPEMLGAEFAVGLAGARGQLRLSTILLSRLDGATERVETYGALGWHVHDGQDVYLHAGGAVAAGPVSGIGFTADDCSDLAPYALPEPTDDPARLGQCWEAHRRIRGLGGDTRGGRAVAAILSALPWRAVLSAFGATVHLGGSTGTQKSTVARLAMQHFSGTLRGRDFPATGDWSSTDNAILGYLHYGKDSLVVIDEYKDDRDARKVAKVVQSQGNLRARGRMGQDQSLKAGLHPRGSLLSTGEADPDTRSALGRTLLVELAPGDVNLGVLTACQADADAGRYATLMASYIRHVAGRRAEWLARFSETAGRYREAIGTIRGAHARHAAAIAELAAAYALFLQWGAETGHVDDIEGHVAWVESALLDLGAEQATYQEESKPGRMFLELLTSGMTAGRCHLTTLQGGCPPSGAACGWRSETRGSATEWVRPGGSAQVGWIDHTVGMAYLDPASATAFVRDWARGRGSQNWDKISRELAREGLIQGAPDGKNLAKVKKIDGVAKRVWWVATDHLFA